MGTEYDAVSNKLKLMKKEKNKDLNLLNWQRPNTPHSNTGKGPPDD